MSVAFSTPVELDGTGELDVGEIGFKIGPGYLLRLRSNGDILVRGKLVENDREVVDGMRALVRWARRSRIREYVTELHRVFEQPIVESPKMLTEDRIKLRISLIGEEFCELLDAFGADVQSIERIEDALEDIKVLPLVDHPDLVESVDTRKVVKLLRTRVRFSACPQFNTHD